MSIIGKNIKYLRKQQGLTQDDLAKKIGVTRSVIGSYEEDRAIPRIDVLKDIALCFNLSLDAIVNVEFWKDETEESSYRKGKKLRILSTVVNTDNKELITLVPAQASAGYTKGYGDSEYIETLPVFSLPFPELSKERTYRVFQINGDSMEPVKSGSYIICEYEADWDEIKNEASYIVITKDDGIVFKRISNIREETVTLKSDNPVYSSYTVEKAVILEIWKALGYVSFNMSGPGDAVTQEKLYKMVENLQSDMQSIKKKLFDS